MSIWRYDTLTRAISIGAFFRSACLFSGSGLEFFADGSGALARLASRPPDWRGSAADGHVGTSTTICPTCGWWTLLHSESMDSRRGELRVFRGAVGALRDIDRTDATLPVSEAQQYLLARWEERGVLHWRTIEETVAAVFKAFGYSVLLSARRSDGGIDVLAHDSASDVIGIQVKHYRRSIKAEQIRALLGAMMVRGLTKGVFVTTGRYQTGCLETARSASARGYSIELVDGDALFDAIGISRIEDPGGRAGELPNVYATRRLWRAPVD